MPPVTAAVPAAVTTFHSLGPSPPSSRAALTNEGFARARPHPRQRGRWQLWVMDSDGSNQTPIDPSDAATLTAVGCVACPYPPMDPTIGYPSMAFWVPATPP